MDRQVLKEDTHAVERRSDGHLERDVVERAAVGPVVKLGEEDAELDLLRREELSFDYCRYE